MIIKNAGIIHAAAAKWAFNNDDSTLKSYSCAKLLWSELYFFVSKKQKKKSAQKLSDVIRRWPYHFFSPVIMTKIISEIESNVWWTRRRKQKPQRECSIAKTGDASDLNRNREVFNLLRVPLPSLARKKRERIEKIKRNNNKNYSAQLKFQLRWKTTKILNWNQFFLMPVSVSSKKREYDFVIFAELIVWICRDGMKQLSWL